ncbi:ferritin family protein [bacterium]|jgi:rubrerythrin|nr:ferritin family protein [bacterium]
MSIFFDISEILQFAIRIEENGEKFYRKISAKVDSKEEKEFFLLLADEEIKHKKIFTDMAESVQKYQPPETYPGEYFQYLRSYADNLVFPAELEKEMVCEDDMDCIIDFAIKRELDSIMYYLEVKDLVKETQHKVLDDIIREERDHFIRLSRFKKQYKLNKKF